MPSTLFLSHSTLSKAHYFPSKPKTLSLSSSLNPPNPTNQASSTNPNPFSLTSTTDKPHPKNLPLEPIKTPTPPWIRTPLLLQPHEPIDLSKPNSGKGIADGKTRNPSGKLSEKLVGRIGRNVVKKIARRIEKLENNAGPGEARKGSEGIAGIVVNVGCLESLERLGGGAGLESRAAERMPWERNEGFVFRRVKKVREASAAELSLDEELLERLRGEAGKMRKWVKVKKAGVTDKVVDEVRSLWRRNELVMVRFDVPLCRNMDRAQEILEVG